MKINDKNTDINGTHYQGAIDISFVELVVKLGEPDEGSDKDLAQWTLEEDGVVATIYDYSVHDGHSSLPLRQVRNWHIGGVDKRAVELVHRALNK